MSKSCCVQLLFFQAPGGCQSCGCWCSFVAGRRWWHWYTCLLLLNSYQLNYSVIEKEALALIWALQYFEVYIGTGGRPVVVYTDHNPVTFLNSCWSLLCQAYRLLVQAPPQDLSSCLPSALHPWSWALQGTLQSSGLWHEGLRSRCHSELCLQEVGSFLWAKDKLLRCSSSSSKHTSHGKIMCPFRGKCGVGDVS